MFYVKLITFVFDIHLALPSMTTVLIKRRRTKILSRPETHGGRSPKCVVLGQEMGQEMARDLGQEMARGLEQEMGQEMVQEMARDLGQETGQEMVQEMARDLGQETGQEMVQEMARVLGQEMGPEMGQELGTKTVPMKVRCMAKRSSGEQCSRYTKKHSSFCSTHQGHSTSLDVVDTHLSQLCVFLQLIHGIPYFVDSHQHVYHTEDILRNIHNPRIVAHLGDILSS